MFVVGLAYPKKTPLYEVVTMIGIVFSFIGFVFFLVTALVSKAHQWGLVRAGFLSAHSPHFLKMSRSCWFVDSPGARRVAPGFPLSGTDGCDTRFSVRKLFAPVFPLQVILQEPNFLRDFDRQRVLRAERHDSVFSRGIDQQRQCFLVCGHGFCSSR